MERTTRPRKMPSESVLFSLTDWMSWVKEKALTRPARDRKEEDIFGLYRLAEAKDAMGGEYLYSIHMMDNP
jgi:hypothetical protein